NPDGSISRGQSFIEAQSHGASGEGLLHSLPAWASALTIIVIFAVIILVGIFLTRPIFRFIHYARLREMYTALALLIVVGIALLMKMIGLSPALGTFLAGVVLANSEFRHELHSDIEPFKGLLLGLFFITVGAGINFSLLFGNPFLIIGQTIGLILVKAAVLFALSLVFRIKGRSRWLFTLSLAQAGEFGFVLVTYALNSNVIPVLLAERLLLIVALSMLVTPLLFLAYEAMAKRMSDVIPGMEGADEIDEQGPVIIAGVGRFGQIVNRLVRNSGIKTIVLDDNLKTIQLMRRFGFKGFFGDPARPELLKAAGIEKARVLVVALDNPEKSTQLVERIRREYKDLHIVARAFDRNHVFELHNAGANDIVRETFDSSLRAGRYVLENAGLTEFEAAEAESTFYQHDRKAMRALTKVWRKSVSPEDNPAYISLSRALEQELEAALLAQLAETKTDPAQPSETPASAKVAMPE
ncbi:MAG: cation:proton antiporter, partial [Paracoccaceae bacterium]